MRDTPTAIDPDDLLRQLYAMIEYADNSCSESEEFMRGMQFMFDVAVEKLDRAAPDLDKRDAASPPASPARPGGLRPA